MTTGAASSEAQQHYTTFSGSSSPHRPAELSAVAALYGEFKALGAEVLSMSTDSRFVHKIWQAEELSRMVDGGVPFPMLSDAGGKDWKP